MNSSLHVQSPLMNAMRERGASRPIVWLVIAAIVGGVFVYAGAAKVPDQEKFASDITNFHIVSWPVAIRMAFYLPWLEIVAGLALLSGFLRRGGLAILTALMVIFIGATISAHARGIELACGCFGAGSKAMSFTSHLLIDLALFAALLLLWISPLVRRNA